MYRLYSISTFVIETLRSQLNLVIFNLRNEPSSEDKYEKIIEMMQNLQYLRITVNRSVRSNQSRKSESEVVVNDDSSYSMSHSL